MHTADLLQNNYTHLAYFWLEETWGTNGSAAFLVISGGFAVPACLKTKIASPRALLLVLLKMPRNDLQLFSPRDLPPPVVDGNARSATR